MKEQYTNEDLKNDIEWLAGYGIKERDAEDFIKYLLKSKPSKTLKW